MTSARYAVVFTALLALAPLAALAQVPATEPTPSPEVTIPSPLPPLVKRAAYISGGYIIPAVVCNEFTPSSCTVATRYRSKVLRAAAELPLGNLTGMVKLDYRTYGYRHETGFVNGIGHAGFATVGAFDARDDDADVRAGVRVLEPRLYLAVSYLRRTNNYGYPRLNGLGFGLEKFPDVDQTFSVYGGAYYYPRVRGSFASFTGEQGTLAYHELRYDAGVTLKPSDKSPVFIDLGYIGDHARNAENAPSNEIRSGPFAGIGLTFPISP